MGQVQLGNRSGARDKPSRLTLESGVHQRLLGLVSHCRLAVDPLDPEPRNPASGHGPDDRLYRRKDFIVTFTKAKWNTLLSFENARKVSLPSENSTRRAFWRRCWI